jgi:hypothetical protein
MGTNGRQSAKKQSRAKKNAKIKLIAKKRLSECLKVYSQENMKDKDKKKKLALKDKDTNKREEDIRRVVEQAKAKAMQTIPTPST